MEGTAGTGGAALCSCSVYADSRLPGEKWWVCPLYETGLCLLSTMNSLLLVLGIAAPPDSDAGARFVNQRSMQENSVGNGSSLYKPTVRAEGR